MGHAALLSGRRFPARRAVAVAAAGALAITALLVTIVRGPHLGVPGDNVASSRSQLQWAATGAISNSLGRDQPAFHVATRDGVLIADNSAQRLTASFGDHGVLVRSGTAIFGLRLLAYGPERHLTPVAPTAPRADANRVLYSHGAVTEWYANGPLGVEQGFDVATEPAPTSGHELTIELGLRGNMRARADGSGGLLLTGPTGQRLRYTGLGASDARGRALHTALTVAAGDAFIHVQTRGAVYPLRIDPFIQVAKFGDPNPTVMNNLGLFAIDVQGTTAVAAETPTGFSTPHVVDVFAAKFGRWELGATMVAQLTDPNTTDDKFGGSLSLTPDARTLAVGAPQANSGHGEVFVFDEPATGWANTATPTATLANAAGTASDALGQSVSISADGTTVAAGAPGRPSNPTTSSVGAIDVFERVGMNWPPTEPNPNATLTHAGGQTGDQLGVSVAQSGNGSTIVAGAWGFGSTATPSLGEAWVWQQPSGGWANNSNPNAVLLAPNAQQFDFFGGAAAISADAKTIVIGATGYQGNRGAAFVFTSPNGTWTSAPPPTATLMSSDGQQEGVGRSVAVATDGRVVVSGTFSVTIGGNMGQGAAYVFVMPPSRWSSETETQRLSASDGKAADSLGQTVGISNGTVIAAAPFADAPGHTDQGFLYAFGTFPTTGISVAPATPDGLNGWYVHPINVAVSASDLASTVTAIKCVLDPPSAPPSFGALAAGCAFPPPGGATLSANGRHVLYAAAANGAGYAASPVSRSFKIDTVAPQVTCAPTPDFLLRGKGGLVAATVADATSGPAAPLVAGAANVSRSGKKTAILTGHDDAGNSTTVDCHYRVVAPRVPTSFSYTFSAFSKYTIFATLTARKVPRGAQVTVGCKGGGCPFKRRVVRPPNTRLVCKPHHKQCKKKPALALANINLAPLIRHRHLHVNAKLTLTVTKLDTIGVISTFTIRHLAAPRVIGPTCLAPGSTRPGKGC